MTICQNARAGRAKLRLFAQSRKSHPGQGGDLLSEEEEAHVNPTDKQRRGGWRRRSRSDSPVLIGLQDESFRGPF